MTDTRSAALAAHNEGVALARAGELAAATARLRSAVEIAGPEDIDPRTLKALWQVAIESGDWPSGIAAGVQASIRDPGDYPFVRNALLSLARCPGSALLSDGRPDSPLPATPPALSVVIVSADDRRFAAVDAEYERAFARWPHERIRISDAHSMYDGYARGFAGSSGEIIVFSHDDIRFAVPDFAARLAGAMKHSDMVGVAGTTRVAGPALLWSGHPHLFGTITHKADGAADFEFSLLSFKGPHVAGAQGLDGVFIAARRALVERIGFDAGRFDGFHFYDLDFSFRAHLAGARVTIAGDLGLIHRSRGSFDERWTDAQRVFVEKFGLAREPPGRDRHWYAVRLPDAEAVAAMYAKLFAAWNLRLV